MHLSTVYFTLFELMCLLQGQGRVSVDFETIEGNALHDVDFFQKRGALVWDDGDTSHRVISIELVNDATSRFRLMFKHMFVRLTNNSGTTQLDPLTFISAVYIVDDEATTGFLSFAPSYVDPVTKTVRDGPVVYRVREGVDDHVNFTVVRSGGNQGNMSVRYRSVGSSAREGVHFKSTSGRLVWPEGDNSDRTISVKLLNDNDFSPFVDVNTFSLVLEDITFSNGVLSAQAYKGPPTAYANVLVAEDDGFGLLGLERTHLTVDEDVGQINISVVRSAGSSGAASVMFGATSGSAINVAADSALPKACTQTPPASQVVEAVAGQARAVHCNAGAEDDVHSASIFFWDYSTQLWDRKCVEIREGAVRNRLFNTGTPVTAPRSASYILDARLVAISALPSAFDYSMSRLIAAAANATVNADFASADISAEGAWQPVALPLQQKVVYIDWDNKKLAWCDTCQNSDGLGCENSTGLSISTQTRSDTPPSQVPASRMLLDPIVKNLLCPKKLKRLKMCAAANDTRFKI